MCKHSLPFGKCRVTLDFHFFNTSTICKHFCFNDFISNLYKKHMSLLKMLGGGGRGWRRNWLCRVTTVKRFPTIQWYCVICLYMMCLKNSSNFFGHCDGSIAILHTSIQWCYVLLLFFVNIFLWRKKTHQKLFVQSDDYEVFPNTLIQWCCV